MVNKEKELSRLINVRNQHTGMPIEFYTTNGFEVADVFPMHTASHKDLRLAYAKACDKFGSINLDCCSGNTGLPKVTVLKNTRAVEHSKYIAIYSE